MKTAVFALTRNGSELALRIGSELEADIFIKQDFVELEVSKQGTGKSAEDENKITRLYPITENFTGMVRRLFDSYDALVFIMACGIVVRTIAPCIKDKRHDPAIVVVDEYGKHAISLLSGHIGGANSLAERAAEITGGTPVITTSTDMNKVIAFDIFAQRNDCVIENIENLKYISSNLVNGGCIGFCSDYEVNGVFGENIISFEDDGFLVCKYAVMLSNRTGIAMMQEKVLYLRPKNLILGIGCKRGTSKEQIANAVKDFMNTNKRSMLALKCLATIDLKKDEKGLLDFCSDIGLELNIFQRDEIKAVEEKFRCSDFVKVNAGVGCVAEPCAVLSGKNSKLIVKKTVYPGITLALSEEEKDFYI